MYLNIILLSGLFFLSSCSSYFKIKKSYTNDFPIKILSRGPGSCTVMVLLNENGEGIAIRGRTNDFYEDRFKKFQFIENYVRFKFDNKDDINKLLLEVKDLKPYITGHINDAKRLEVYIYGKKTQDFYSRSETKVDDLIRKLQGYIPFNIDEQCTFTDQIKIKSNGK